MNLRQGVVVACVVMSGCMTVARPQPASDAGKAASEQPAPAFAPLPESRSVAQSMTLDGKPFEYAVTVGSLPVVDKDGKQVADVVFTAYVHGEPNASRPVTFAINGGPGAASAFLNFGAIGPKFVAFAGQDDRPSDAAPPQDNPAAWLKFTDLVFIDPVGAGYSRSYLSTDDTKKRFYTLGPDIDYLSQVIADWLTRNARMASPKYIVGESYGGFRAPRLAHHLQTVEGVGVSGIVLVSPLLDWGDRVDRDFSPMSWVVTLPSMAAVKLEREGRLTDAALREVEDYARGEYAVDLLKGRSDPQSYERLARHTAQLTGLDPKLTQEMGGRIDVQTYLRELYRDQQKMGSIYDASVSAWDPFPFDAARRPRDPIVESMLAPLSTAMVEFLTRTLGWPVTRPYHVYDRNIAEQWDWGPDKVAESVTDLREALALDPGMRAIIAMGYTDIITPYFAARLIVDQVPEMGERDRLRLALYHGGHMFYRQGESRMALSRDVEAMMKQARAAARPAASAGDDRRGR